MQIPESAVAAEMENRLNSAINFAMDNLDEYDDDTLRNALVAVNFELTDRNQERTSIVGVILARLQRLETVLNQSLGDVPAEMLTEWDEPDTDEPVQERNKKDDITIG